MGKDLIPELHDVLKITTLQHNLSDFDEYIDYAPKTLTWKGVIQHHCGEDFPLYPTDKETFILHIADGLAAGFSRHQQSYKGEKNFNLYKLWNPPSSHEDPRLKDKDSIITLLKFLQSDPSFEEFLKKYGDKMRNRAEDARPGWNITSLYTHSVLTGKFYRLITSSSSYIIKEEEIPKDKDGITKLTNEIKKQKACIVLAKILFLQKPVRARDLNIFYILDELIKNIENRFKDNLLFHFGNEILMFFDQESRVNEVINIVKEHGFKLEVIKNERPLEDIEPDPKAKPGSRHIVEYSDLLPSINPPICEICQMAPATKIWPNDYLTKFGSDLEIAQEGIEHLCEICFSVRARPSHLRKLKVWSEEENTGVVWVHLNLDYENLLNSLRNLYTQYLSSSSQVSVGFSLVTEFQYDFINFTDNFISDLKNMYGEDYTEQILKSFLCIKVDSKSQILKILSIYKTTIDRFFPKFKDLDNSPLKLSLIYAPSKFPFFEIWKLIESNEDDINICLIGHYPIKTSLKYIEALLSAAEAQYRKSALHKLAEIAKLSEILAYLKFKDSSEKEDYRTYKTLKNLLPFGMNFRSILSFSELLED